MDRTLIKNALIYDGTGERPFYSDLLIEGSKIKRIAYKIDEQPGDEIIDAAGKALCPGFINTHSHMELEIIRDPELRSVIGQGITTEVLGQDGSSVAPLTDELAEELADNMAPLAGRLGKPYYWRSFAEYEQAAADAKPQARFVGLVGHGTIRMNVMGSENRRPTADELEQMKALLGKCFDEGAKGMSLGLIYPPGSYADTDELIEMAKVVAQHDGLIMVHIRSESTHLLEAVDEMARVVRESGVRLQFSHHKAMGKPCRGMAKQTVEKIRQLRSEGFDVTVDQYPWLASCTGLKVCAPGWSFAGGEQGFKGRLADPDSYQKMLTETAAEIEARGGANSIMITQALTEDYSWISGLRLNEIADRLQMKPEAAALHLLDHQGSGLVAIYFCMAEEDVIHIMKQPFHCVCTDGIINDRPHPRAFGSFPKFLGEFVREKKVMPLETAIRHITYEPARRLRLWDRGVIREGMDADLVLFDPETIINQNSYLEPCRGAEGIYGVWVLGKRAL